MQTLKFFSMTGLFILSITTLIGCSKANAPTNKNFEKAITAFIKGNASYFSITMNVAKGIVTDDHATPLCTSNDGSYGECSNANIAYPYFKILKDNGVFVKTGDQSVNYLKRNINFQLEINSYNRKINEAKAYCQVHTRFNLASPAAAHRYYACQNLQWNNVDGAHANDPIFVPAAPNPYNMVSRNLPYYTISAKYLKYAQCSYSCVLEVGRRRIKKVMSSTEPAANANGEIVSEVKVLTEPKEHSWAKGLMQGEGPKEFTFNVKQLTNGWSVSN